VLLLSCDLWVEVSLFSLQMVVVVDVVVVVAVNELDAPLIVSIQAEMVELTCYHEIS
jgi:hypothetical protein